MKMSKFRCAVLFMLIAQSAQSQSNVPISGYCPAGTHAVHSSGVQDLLRQDAADTELLGDSDDASSYRCVSNFDAALVCGARGSSISIGGAAACACETGYAGASCTVCASGYSQDASGGCTPALANRELIIVGAESVVSYGSSRVLSAQYLAAGARFATGTWQLRGVPEAVGCLSPVSESNTCASVVQGTEVRYTPPPRGQGFAMQQVLFQPDNGVPMQIDLKIDLQNQVPINGWADVSTLPVVNALLDFMKARCVGAGSLGIARHGKVIAALGLGMMDGRNAETIYNPACSSDGTDPFKPSAGEMQYDTPFMFGSISKATSYATSREVLKTALAAKDIDVRVIDQANNRVVSASRDKDSILHVAVWALDASGGFNKLAFHAPDLVKDFQLVRMSDSRFVLVTRSVSDKTNIFAYTLEANGTPKVSDVAWGVTSIKQVQVVAINAQQLALGLRLENDTLQMRTIKVDANGQLSTLAVETGGGTRDLRLIALPGSTRIVGAARLPYPDVVKFIVWNVSATGQLSRIHESTLNNMLWENSQLEMAPLSANSIVVGSKRTPYEDLVLAMLRVSATGALSEVGATSLANVSEFRLQALSDSRFLVGASDSSKKGTLQQYALSGTGLPYLVGVRTNAGIFDSLDLALTDSAGFGTGFVTAVRDYLGNLRLLSWSAQNTSLSLLKQTVGPRVYDHAWSDSEIEALPLVGFDLPDGLLPKRLYQIVAGHIEPPLHFDVTASETENGVAGVTLKEGTPANTCSAKLTAGYPFADARWKNIRLRDFYSHRTGMNRSAAGTGKLYSNLGKLRGLSSKGQWSAQEDRVTEQWGAQNVEKARLAAGLTGTVNYADPDGFLLPRLSLEELLVGSASTCLNNPQGSYAYSNTDPQWLRAVMEHVGGKSFTAATGKPSDVAGTLLNDFIAKNLNVDSNGLNGIAGRPTALNGQGKDPFPGPRPRHWSAGVQPYYDQYWDSKRPRCIWKDNDCQVSDPSLGPSLDWNGNLQKVPLIMRSGGEGAATGGLAVQILPHLKFMSKYWASGYDSKSAPGLQNPSIGELRNGVWNVDQAHSGGDNGTYAWAIQFGDGCKDVPANIRDAVAGIDLIVSVNQWQDRECNTGKNSCEDNKMRYQEFYNLMRNAVCNVDWRNAKPIPWLN
jgi:hypothetical protein